MKTVMCSLDCSEQPGHCFWNTFQFSKVTFQCFDQQTSIHLLLCWAARSRFRRVRISKPAQFTSELFYWTHRGLRPKADILWQGRKWCAPLWSCSLLNQLLNHPASTCRLQQQSYRYLHITPRYIISKEVMKSEPLDFKLYWCKNTC